MVAGDFARDLRQWAERESDPVAGFFGPGSTTWRINREIAVYLGGLRALLLQIAHPKVAQGVADHSNFRNEPLSRLRRTFDTVHAMVFGTREEALTAAARLWAVHRRVRGRLRPEVEGMDSAYAATDPELLLWVLVTLVDSSLHAYSTFFRPLHADELRSFHEDAKKFARLCGLRPDEVPASHVAFQRYVDTMIRGPELVVTATAREIADSLLKGPPLLWLFRPSNYVLASGMLPPPVREQYGLRWTLPVRVAYRVGVRAVRGLVPRLPPVMRHVPSARRAERRCAIRPPLAA